MGIGIVYNSGMKEIIPKARLLIGTKDTRAIERFYWNTIRPHSEKLIDGIALWIRTSPVSVLDVIGWNLKSKFDHRHWNWASRLPTVEHYQTFYSRQDELLTKLQDPKWKGAFEQAYALHQLYGSLLVHTLAYPKKVEALITRSAAKAELWKEDPASLERLSKGILKMLSNPITIGGWNENV